MILYRHKYSRQLGASHCFLHHYCAALFIDFMCESCNTAGCSNFGVPASNNNEFSILVYRIIDIWLLLHWYTQQVIVKWLSYAYLTVLCSEVTWCLWNNLFTYLFAGLRRIVSGLKQKWVMHYKITWTIVPKIIRGSATYCISIFRLLQWDKKC